MTVSVSIIIPVYNGQNTILKCLENIIKKNKKINKEIIVITMVVKIKQPNIKKS